jgi:hypothetical protein
MKFTCVERKTGVLPGASRRDVVLICSDAIPGRGPEIGVMSCILGVFQDVWRYVGLRKVGYRLAAGFEQQENILALDDPTPCEAHTHAPTQTLYVQKHLGRRLGY